MRMRPSHAGRKSASFMLNGKQRASRTSARQFELLLGYVERHPCMVNPRFPSSAADRERHWCRLTERLNADGQTLPKEKDRWKKTWFDWKCNVRAKARSASGKKSLSPLEERLIAVTGMLDTDDAGTARRDAPLYADTVYEIEDGPARFRAAGASSHTADDDDDSAESVTPTGDSTYGESQGEYIVPTSVVSTPLRLVLPSGQPPLVLSDVRSLASPSGHSGVVVKQEVVIDDDGEDAREASSSSSSSAGSSPNAKATSAREPHGGAGDQHEGPWFRNRKRPTMDGHDEGERGDSVAGWNKARLEIEVLLATKRKLEADERRADAEAEFYEQEKKRSAALASLHQEEKRKMAAMVDFHVEERRRAAAKVEMLVEHRNFYLQQQKTEALRRRLIQLEMQRLKKELGNPAAPHE